MPRFRRIAASIALIGASALVVAGCAEDGSGGGDGGGDGDKPYIALVSKGFQHQFWQAVKSGADQGSSFVVALIGVTWTAANPACVRGPQPFTRRPSCARFT